MREHSTIVASFRAERSEMNARILSADNLVIKRLFNLDARAYEEGALSTKTKELLGLMGSLVLRCDDCVKYHIEQCVAAGTSEAEFFELLSVANLIGGTIVIPHTRRAVSYWDALQHHNNQV